MRKGAVDRASLSRKEEAREMASKEGTARKGREGDG